MFFKALVAAALGVIATAGAAQARDQINIVGSSTVYPFATVVAERFGRSAPFAAPKIEATGSGGGIKLFCAGIGVQYPDIVNSSRRIKQSEIDTCAGNGVDDITEVKIGYDGIVIANSKQAEQASLTKKQIFLALAKEVPVDGKLVANPYRMWSEIGPSLPKKRIEVLGPPPTSGTRDAFVELVMEEGCDAIPEIEAITDKAKHKAICHGIREDGAYIEAGENDNLVVQKLGANPDAFGILGFSFLEQNFDRLQGSIVDGGVPTFENIASGKYPVSRPLYFYVKKAHVGKIPGIREYIAEFTSDRAFGPDGYLSDRGLIPLPADERAEVRKTARTLAKLSLRPGRPAAGTADTDAIPANPEDALFDRSASDGQEGIPILPLTVAILLLLVFASFRLGRSRAIAAAGGSVRNLHSLPNYYGFYLVLWCAVPAFVALALWIVVEPAVVTALVVDSLPPEIQALPEGRLDLVLNDIRNIAQGNIAGRPDDPTIRQAADYYRSLHAGGLAIMMAVVLSLAVGGLAFGRRFVSPTLRARNAVERAAMTLLILASTVAILTTIGIVLSLIFEAMRFFRAVPVTEFLFGLDWSPQIALRADQVASSGAFGAVPIFAGTLLITAIAMLVAVPIGLMSAIYMAEYANPRLRAVVKPMLEVLAGIPTVVYGFFAALIVAPLLRDSGAAFGIGISSESALAAGAVMGIMIIPFVSSLSDDVMTAVPQSMREGSYGLGATRSETIKRVVLPAALPGIVGGVLLAASRAIGETMIVVMAAGLSANLTANPFEAVTTVTVQIVTLLVGDQEFDSPKTLAAFALGLVLFVITLALNVAALSIVRKYREKYE